MPNHNINLFSVDSTPAYFQLFSCYPHRENIVMKNSFENKNYAMKIISYDDNTNNMVWW